eukprot:1409994-Rhodomonas_salina.1
MKVNSEAVEVGPLGSVRGTVSARAVANTLRRSESASQRKMREHSNWRPGLIISAASSIMVHAVATRLRLTQVTLLDCQCKSESWHVTSRPPA